MNISNLITGGTIKGVAERLAYAAILALMMKLVQWQVIEASDAPYYAAVVVGAAGSAWATYINRPSAIATDAKNLTPAQVAAPEVSQPLAQAAASIPNPQAPDGKTIVVTSAAVANAVPEGNVQSGAAR